MHSCGSVSQPVRIICIIQTNVIQFRALLCLAWHLNAARCDDITALLCLAWPLNAARCDDFTLVLQEGLTQLLRHSSHRDLVPGQHTCILRALMHQGELAAASRYLSMRNPPVLTAGDLKMRLTILVANRLVNWKGRCFNFLRDVFHIVGHHEKIFHSCCISRRWAASTAPFLDTPHTSVRHLREKCYCRNAKSKGDAITANL